MVGYRALGLSQLAYPKMWTGPGLWTLDSGPWTLETSPPPLPPKKSLWTRAFHKFLGNFLVTSRILSNFFRSKHFAF